LEGIGWGVVIHLVICEEGKARLTKVKRLMKSAKWNMYAELWETAEHELEKARRIAVHLRNKSLIDEILVLLSKCEEKEKPETLV
jgi:hypothetical protein